jgi:hypothetical protein
MAGGKGATFDNDLLKLILNGVAIPNIANNATSSPLTNLYLSLHIADPGAGGSQTTSEAAYTSYARQPVSRTSSGFTVTGTSAALATSVVFPAATGTSDSEMETWAALGTALSGAGKILYRGPLTPSISVTLGIAPQLAVGTTITES